MLHQSPRPNPLPRGRGRKRISTSEIHTLLQVTIEPGKRSLQRIDAMPWLAQAVTLARVTHEDRVHAATFESHVHLFGLGDMNIVVLFAVNEQRRRLRLSHITKRRPLPKQVVIVPGKAAELSVNQILIKRSRIKADQITDTRGRD